MAKASAMSQKPAPAFDWDELTRLERRPTAIPENVGFTVSAFAAKKGLKLSAARERVRGLMAAGTVVRIGVRETRDSGDRRIYIPVYDIVRVRRSDR